MVTIPDPLSYTFPSLCLASTSTFVIVGLKRIYTLKQSNMCSLVSSARQESQLTWSREKGRGRTRLDLPRSSMEIFLPSYEPNLSKENWNMKICKGMHVVCVLDARADSERLLRQKKLTSVRKLCSSLQIILLHSNKETHHGTAPSHQSLSQRNSHLSIEDIQNYISV